VAPEPADWTPITPGDVQYYIDTVKGRKAAGPDGIFPDVYRKISEKISSYLAKLYTECLKTGTFPAPWKRGRLVILHKSPGNQGMTTGFCPGTFFLESGYGYLYPKIPTLRHGSPSICGRSTFTLARSVPTTPRGKMTSHLPPSSGMV